MTAANTSTTTPSCHCHSTMRRRQRTPRKQPSSVIVAFSFCAFAVLSSGSAFAPATAYRRRTTSSSATSLHASTAVPTNSGSSWWNNNALLPELELPKNPFNQKQQQQQESKSHIDSAAVDQWAAKYCTVAGLRESFGSNHNVLWGDLDACNTRRLYKSLLPVALLELKDCGVTAESLAPLAYKARVAAKLYARERSRVPSRLAANLFDGYRQWRKYGSFDMTGMTYQQVWDKYAALVEDETADADGENDVTTKICLKILERSCICNEKIDRMVLNNKRNKAELKHITDQLENDVKLLLNMNEEEDDDDDNDRKRQAQKFRALRQIAKVKRRIAKFNKQQQHEKQ